MSAHVLKLAPGMQGDKWVIGSLLLVGSINRCEDPEVELSPLALVLKRFSIGKDSFLERINKAEEVPFPLSTDAFSDVVSLSSHVVGPFTPEQIKDYVAWICALVRVKPDFEPSRVGELNIVPIPARLSLDFITRLLVNAETPRRLRALRRAVRSLLTDCDDPTLLEYTDMWMSLLGTTHSILE